ncbi:MAG: hypothetical protein IK048_03250 [Clostridia bacterium]|nr:hypothetical protein [Clostridia bacterium]
MDYQWLFDRPIAHRGLHNEELPENSIPAFQNAIDHDFNIEIDVHLTKDGRLVVFHDDNLKRICGVDKLVKNCTLEELKTYRLKDTENQIPTFDEFLDLVNDQVGILCEIKGINPFKHDIARATIERLKTYDGRIALQAFNFGDVAYARKRTELPVGELCTWVALDLHTYRWLPCNFMGKLWVNKYTKPDFISYDVRGTLTDYTTSKGKHRTHRANDYIVKWSKRLPVIFWTVDSDENVEQAKRYASNIIFEKIGAEKANEAFKDLQPFTCEESALPKNFERKELKPL